MAEAVDLIAGEHNEGRSAVYHQAALRAITAGDTTLAKGIAESFIVLEGNITLLNNVLSAATALAGFLVTAQSSKTESWI